MNFSKTKSLRSIRSIMFLAATMGCVTVAAPQAAQASELLNGWNYAIDSFEDGEDGYQVGSNSVFEFYGLAYREYEDTVVFAVNSNLSIDGDDSYWWAQGGGIKYGDLFINFGDTDNFYANEGTDNLYGVRFAENDGGSQTGLFSNVTSQNLARENLGSSTMADHTYKVENWFGGSDSLGDHEADTDYFDRVTESEEQVRVTATELPWDNSGDRHVGTNRRGREIYENATYGRYSYNPSTGQYNYRDTQTVTTSEEGVAATHIQDGSYVDSITVVNEFDSDLDFGHFGAVGQYTFGFSIDKSKLQVGNFVAHLLEECNNDGIVLEGEILGRGVRKVPESSPLAAVAAVGLLGGAALLRKRKQQLEAQLAMEPAA